MAAGVEGIRTTPGQQQMVQMRAQIGEMNREENRLLKLRSEEAGASLRTARIVNLSRLGRRQLKMEPTSLDELLTVVLADFKAENQGRQIEWKMGKLPLVDAIED